MDSDFNEKLNHLRQAVSGRRVTQAEIALATGVSQSQISRILAGPVKRRSENVQKLCDFVGLLPVATIQTDMPTDEAFLLLAEVMAGGPEIGRGVVEILRHVLALRRLYETEACK